MNPQTTSTMSPMPTSIGRILYQGLLRLSLIAWLAVGALFLLKHLIFSPILEKGRHLLNRETSLKLGAALVEEYSLIKMDGDSGRPIIPEKLKKAFANEEYHFIAPTGDGVCVQYGGGFHGFGLKLRPLEHNLVMLLFYDEIQFPELIGGEKVLAIWEHKPPAQPVLIWSR
jgi:hypothetical protein